ncbi:MULTISPECIES: MerR family transcriptional regulator [unclassified Variovorax]|uniref:MerR family transcriptional regulator n=1 Tax=unclassified Variovorax TaxID=663243 RepID=UPI002576FE75|nr:MULTISPECIES: MerR family transcriptional regulator [unclassified Variovorax]MDM0089846.1 MerR family transcriptional regulator [Variovorax sp. J22G40]MDM0148488.1 MerR family transcriptional regulator [Variovorax sp. J2P1-31]
MNAAPATAAPAQDLAIEALAARTGVTVRNIRAYTTARLLPPPRLQGRLGLYGDEHVQRLALIRELREQGFGIEAIRRIFGRTPAASWRDLLAVARSVSGSLFAEETPVVVSAKALAAKWKGQMTPALLARAAKAGLMHELPDGRIQLLSPALGQVAEQLAALGLPLEDVIGMQETMARTLRTVARHWLRTLADSLLSGDALDADRLAQLLEKARPLATGAVQAAFPVILQQELDTLLHKAA